VARQAQHLISPGDVLVIYGYSTSIAKLLENLRGQDISALYIVDCYKPIGVHLGPDENERIITLVNELGFTQVRFLYVPVLAQVLRDLKQRQISSKLLLGAHGRLKGGDFLCKVGSDILVTTARRFGTEVIIFCEKAKFLINGCTDADVAGPGKLFATHMCERHPELKNTLCFSPPIDIISKELVNYVVTEKGVEEAITMLPTTVKFSEEKASNPS
jgi:translation initiation factor 2B subunit (eIF-2B alpha/beta/delta family)